VEAFFIWTLEWVVGTTRLYVDDGRTRAVATA